MKRLKKKMMTFKTYEWEECTPPHWTKASWAGRLTCWFLKQHVRRLGINNKKNPNYTECERCNKRWRLRRKAPINF